MDKSSLRPQDLSYLSLPGVPRKELGHRSSHKGHLTVVEDWLCPALFTNCSPLAQAGVTVPVIH